MSVLHSPHSLHFFLHGAGREDAVCLVHCWHAAVRAPVLLLLLKADTSNMTMEPSLLPCQAEIQREL